MSYAADIRLKVIEHLRELLCDLQMVDEAVDAMSDDQMRIVMDNALTIAGYILDSMGFTPVSMDPSGRIVAEMTLEEPSAFLDRVASQEIVQ